MFVHFREIKPSILKGQPSHGVTQLTSKQVATVSIKAFFKDNGNNIVSSTVFPSVPLLLIRLFEYLHEKGIGSPTRRECFGVFRESGSMAKRNEFIRTQSSAIAGHENFDMTKVTPVLAGAIIKAYLRDLNPSISSHGDPLYKELMSLVNEEKVYIELDALNVSYAGTLCYVICQLYNIASYGCTKLTAKNLATYFGPNLFACNNKDTIIKDTKEVLLLTERLIAACPRLTIANNFNRSASLPPPVAVSESKKRRGLMSIVGRLKGTKHSEKTSEIAGVRSRMRSPSPVSYTTSLERSSRSPRVHTPLKLVLTPRASSLCTSEDTPLAVRPSPAVPTPNQFHGSSPVNDHNSSTTDVVSESPVSISSKEFVEEAPNWIPSPRSSNSHFQTLLFEEFEIPQIVKYEFTDVVSVDVKVKSKEMVDRGTSPVVWPESETNRGQRSNPLRDSFRNVSGLELTKMSANAKLFGRPSLASISSRNLVSSRRALFDRNTPFDNDFLTGQNSHAVNWKVPLPKTVWNEEKTSKENDQL